MAGSARLVRGLVLCMLCLGSFATDAQQDPDVAKGPFIRLSTDTQTIYLGDVIVVDVESTGLLDPVDTDPLFKQADFVRETTGTMISVVQGKVVEVALRRIELMPKAEGLLVLGPLSGESSSEQLTSNTLGIMVEPTPSAEWIPEEGAIELLMSVSEPNPFVSEQIELSIQLSHQYAVASESVILPSLDGFDISPIVEERRLIDNTTDMRTTTWRYHLYPQRSGEYLLDGVTWAATLIRSRAQRYHFSLIHDPIRIDVAPVPENFPENTWWLAASSVSLSDRWSSNVIELSAGDEITRSIDLKATGVLSNHLPVVKPLATRSFHSTPLPVSRTDSMIGDVQQANGLYEFRMIAESPVSVFLDTVRVPWFNTQTRKIEEAIIPARRIDIALPKRPDQLAELAVKRHQISRLKLKLRSFSIQQWLSQP